MQSLCMIAAVLVAALNPETSTKYL